MILKWPLQTLDFGAVLGGKKEGRIRMPAIKKRALASLKYREVPSPLVVYGFFSAHELPDNHTWLG